MMPSNRPWRAFPSDASHPDVRAWVAKLPNDVVERALKAARRDLTRALTEELKEREVRTGRTLRGYRYGVWPPARVLRETILLAGTQRLIAACAGVMVLESDEETERHVGDALDAVNNGERPSAAALVRALRGPLVSAPRATVLAEIAWAFRDYGKRALTNSPKSPTLPEVQVPESTTTKAGALAIELEEAHTALLGSMTKLRVVVGDLDAAREVRRDDAERALEGALQSAQRVRDGLAAAALIAPDAVGLATSSDHLASVVQRASDALRALAAPRGRAHLERLATELAGGRIVASNPMRRKTLERSRVAAVGEAQAGLLASDESVASFPGPSDESAWLAWYWSTTALDETTHIASVLDGKWDRIFEFLGSIQTEDWAAETKVEDGATTVAANLTAGLAFATSTPPTPNTASEPVHPAAASSAERAGTPATVDAPAQASAEVVEFVEVEAVPGEAVTIVGSPQSGGPLTAIHDGAQGNTSPEQKGDVANLEVHGSNFTATNPGGESPNANGELRVVSAFSGDGARTAPVRTPLHLPSFEQFRRTHWVDATGQVTAAPWSREESRNVFIGRALGAMVQCMLADDWAQARLLLLCLHQLTVRAVPRLGDFEHAVALRAGRWASLSEEDQVDMASDLRRLLEKTDIQGDLRDRLRVAVGLAVPAVVKLLSEDELEQLIELAGFSERFRSFLVGWAGVARVLPDPFSALSRQLRLGQPPSLEELKAQEDAASTELRNRVRDLNQAAGNRVQRTHCRAAWDQFLTEARPCFDAALASPMDPATRTEVARLRKKATKIFDRNDAKFTDRTSMDRAVDSLIDASDALFAAADAARVASSSAGGSAAFPLGVTQLIPLAQGDLSTEEQLLHRLFTTHLSKPANPPSSVLSSTVVESRPWILSTWPLGSEPSRSADVSQCEDALTAAAHLLGPPAARDADGSLRTWVLDNAPWLLAHFTNLTERERAVIEDLRRHQRDALDDVLARLRKRHVDLAELADQDAGEVLKVINDIESEGSRARHDEAHIGAWAAFVLAVTEEHVERTLKGVADEAERRGLARTDVDLLLARRRYADLHVRTGRATSATGVPHVRATPFRNDGARRWPEPRTALATLGADPGEENEPLRILLRAWCHYSKHASTPLGADKQRALRDAFVEVVFEQTTKRRKSRINPTTSAHRISCTDVADWLSTSARPPTFLPQLHRYSELVIKVQPVSAADRALPAKLLGLGEDGVITVVLAPGLTEQGREDARQQIRQATGKPIALLDDLDLCRLLNPGGQQPALIEALAELAVEQQRWEEFGPYEVQEGQHVRMEMYVGRRTEAERLVTGTTYSRIFSGRRLGKTALLRYVEHRYDDTPLPSGNTLRVLYVPIVGLGSEAEVVAEIVDKLAESSGARAPIRETPRERLKSAIASALDAKPNESFLVFLDEADTFFENQARSADFGQGAEESSLSWAMRDSERIKDAKQHPRIRFVVCGYRATNRSEGAWGNWGDVLLLNPLDPADAVQLVSGPLARLGIDARDQADAIAFRCGYQPAVIIYFCVRLLDELERRTAFTERERRVVSAEDVVSVFQLPEVQDRVRETCWLNFVGDPLGQLTFAAFLAVSAELAPGTPIDDAPQRILTHVLQESDGKPVGELGVGTWQDIGSRHLRDLVKRSLLSEAEHHPLSLRLRFPHQLPILLQESPQVRIRDALNRLGTSRVEKKRTEWLVSEDVLENMRWCLGRDAWDLGVRSVVFGSHWSAPLLARTGLLHRLPDGQLLHRPARPDDLDASIAEGRALVGGADLLRAALARQKHVGQAIELARLGRLTSEAVDSYFKRARGVEFASPGALTQIMKLTGGVPLVLAKLSPEFPEGATVTASQLEHALSTATAAIPMLRKDLVAGPADLRLERREIELLQLLIIASTHAPDALGVFLSDPDLVRDAARDMGLSAGAAGIDPFGPGDNERLVLLLTLGLIPRRSLGEASGWALGEVAAIPEGDVLRTLVSRIPGESAS